MQRKVALIVADQDHDHDHESQSLHPCGSTSDVNSNEESVVSMPQSNNKDDKNNHHFLKLPHPSHPPAFPPPPSLHHHDHHHHHQNHKHFFPQFMDKNQNKSMIATNTHDEHQDNNNDNNNDNDKDGFNNIKNTSHNFPFPDTPHGIKHGRRISFDDIDVSKSKLEKKGSIPMIGSLVYYRHKNKLDNDNEKNNHNNDNNDNKNNIININNHHHKQHHHQNHHQNHHRINNNNVENNIPLPMVKNNSNISPNNSEFSNSDASIDSSEVSTPIASQSNSIDLDDNNEYKYNQPHHNHQLFRHFSSPQLFVDHYNSNEDEFSIINAKIKSHIKKNNSKFNKYLSDEIKKAHFNNKHFHIPGLDPEPSSDSSEICSHQGSPIPSEIPSRSSSLSKLDSSSTKQLNAINDEKQSDIIIKKYQPTVSNEENPPINNSINNDNNNNNNNTNNRHRRRLTCAMIFTRPKVVEI